MAKKKKSMQRKTPEVKVSGPIPSMELHMPLTPSKIKQIQRCLDKGTLRIKFSKVDLGAGKLGGSWLYD